MRLTAKDWNDRVRVPARCLSRSFTREAGARRSQIMSKALVRARARADEDYVLIVTLSTQLRHRITAPSADATSPAARSTVALAPTGSAKAEFTSTTSSDPSLPVAASASQRKWASR